MQACRHASMHPILDARAPTRGLDTHHHVPRPPPPPTRAPPPWTSRAPSFVPSPPRVRPRLSSHASIHSFIPSIHPSTHPRETSRPARTLSRPSRCRPLRKKDKRWSSHTLDYERESPSKHHDMSVHSYAHRPCTTHRRNLNPLEPPHRGRLAISIE